MNVPSTLTAFAAALAAVFAAAAAVGSSVGPVGTAQAVTAGHRTASGHDSEPVDATADAVPEGLTATRGGYALRLAASEVVVGADTDLRFTIVGPDDEPETRFALRHDRPMHLIVVGRDLSSFQHVHPRLLADGSWTVGLRLVRAGAYRVLADFAPGDGSVPMTLGADLLVAGDYQPAALPAEAVSAVVDGYTVTLDGTLKAGKQSRVTLSVSRHGRPVTDLEPYLGAYGHLVALRAGDLGYLHVHPHGEPDDGGTASGPLVPFSVEVPSKGAYRLFLDFKHDGVVRTAAFTQSTDADRPAAPSRSGAPHDSTDHAH